MLNGRRSLAVQSNGHYSDPPFAQSAGAIEYTTLEDTKQSNGDIPAMLELWGVWHTPSLPSLPDPLWPKVVVPDRVLSMGLKELNCVLEIELFICIKIDLALNNLQWLFHLTKPI